eukprot:6488431-Amphidinium_carterae.2
MCCVLPKDLASRQTVEKCDASPQECGACVAFCDALRMLAAYFYNPHWRVAPEWSLDPIQASSAIYWAWTFSPIMQRLGGSQNVAPDSASFTKACQLVGDSECWHGCGKGPPCTLAQVDKIAAPVAIIHGTEDEATLSLS